MSIRRLNIAPRAGLGFGVLALMVFALGGFADTQYRAAVGVVVESRPGRGQRGLDR